jgi:AraC-like DNA-binding protein
MERAGNLASNWLGLARRYDFHLTPALPVFAGVIPRLHPTSLITGVHPGVEVGIVLTGQYEWVFEDVRFRLNPGQVWLCAMCEPHAWRTVLPDAAAAVLIFLPEFLGEEMFETVPWLGLFAAPPGGRPRASTPEARRAALAIGQELASEIEGKASAWRSAVRFNLLRLLVLLYREWDAGSGSAAGLPSHTNKLSRIMPALTLLRERAGFRASVTEAAAACSLSRSQFHRMFLQTMGLSFGEFRLRGRLGFTAHRLLTSPAPTDAIAQEAGFADASHLHRSFVKHYGSTPGAYRRQAR